MIMARLKLVVESREDTFHYKGEDSAVKIGRSLKCEFNIPKDDLSREHCLFEVIGEEYFVTDLKSKNGLIVDGKRLVPETKTKVTEESNIVLSNVYYLKINPISVKTKADIILKKINPEIDTHTFKLDLESLEKNIPAKPIRKQLRKSKETVAEKPQRENIKMLLGFILILGFVIYQALG